MNGVIGKCFILILVLIGMVSCNVDNDELIIIDDAPKFEPEVNTLVVKFDEETSCLIETALQNGIPKTRSHEYDCILDDLSISSLRRLFPEAGKFESRTRLKGLHRWYVVDCNPMNDTKALDRIESFEGVEFVDVLLPVKRTDVFDDPYLKLQWHYYNDAALTEHHVLGADVNVVPVWENYTVGDEHVIVAVVDGGIDQRHEDLSAHCIGGYNFVRNNEVIIAHEHGTHVAGTISAVNNNGKGVAGIAGGDALKSIRGVSLLSCQIFDYDPTTGKEVAADGAAAIKWAADHGAVIAQNSWGYEFESYDQAKITTIPRYLMDAIDYFVEFAGIDENGIQSGPMRGGTVIFAAGNSGWDTDPIGEYSKVISVGAVGPDMRRTKYSNYGDWVDIAAPGGTAEIDRGMVMSTIPNNSYGYLQGTSMACPHVSGVAALLLSYFGSEGFTPVDLKQRLIGGADDYLLHGEKVGPMLDALGAFSYGSDIAPDPVVDVMAVPDGNTVNLNWTVTRDEDDEKAYGFVVLVSTKMSDLFDIDMTDIPRNVQSYEYITGYNELGASMKVRITGLDYGRTYYCSVCAFDRMRNYSEVSKPIAFTTKTNSSPVITLDCGNVDALSIGAHEIAELKFCISDPEEHPVSIRVENGVSIESSIFDSGKMLELIIKGNGDMPGVYTATLVAEDALGASNRYSFTYELLENQGPKMIKAINDTVVFELGVQMEYDLNDYFKDTDGGTLKYSLEFGAHLSWDISLTKSFMRLIPFAYGSTAINVIASDSYGAECLYEFRVAARSDNETISLFPNPVSDYLQVNSVVDDSVKFVIVAMNGKVMYDKVLHLSPFSNVKIDVRTYPAGRYKVFASTSQTSLEKTIVKL